MSPYRSKPCSKGPALDEAPPVPWWHLRRRLRWRAKRRKRDQARFSRMWRKAHELPDDFVLSAHLQDMLVRLKATLERAGLAADDVENLGLDKLSLSARDLVQLAQKARKL